MMGRHFHGHVTQDFDLSLASLSLAGSDEASCHAGGYPVDGLLRPGAEGGF